METLPGEPDLSALKVMVVDDSPAVRAAAEARLRALGCRVTALADGYAALAALAERRPDLILADVAMPRLNGYQLCTLIKNHPAYVTTPVILLTGGHNLVERARARGARCDDWLEKPFTGDTLAASLRRGLGATRSAA